MNPMASTDTPAGGMPPSMGAAPMGQAPTPQMGGSAPSAGNVMQITSTLRGMSDQQLQQYASMHKSDPFVFPLAFQESQTRQQMRAGQAAQMAGQKPPPVVDQDLAQMMPQPLPEEQGIGAIPAQNLQRMADGGIAGYAGDDESLVHFSPFAMKQIMGDMATSGAGVNANADLGEAGRLSGGVNLNRMDKDRESRQMQALMANYMNNIGDVGINANVNRPLERGLPSDFYQTNLMGSVPVGEGRLTIGKHGTHAGGEHHTNAHSIGYNTPFEGGRLNANINKPVEGRPSFGVQYNRAFADGGVAGYADGGQQPGMFNYAQMAPAVDLHPNSGVTPRSMAGGGMAHFKKGGYEPITDEELKAVEYIAPDATKMQENILGMAQPMTNESAAIYKPFADYYQQQQKELSGRKDKNIDNALLTAGLSMMGGTSQHALQNISKGGLEGLNAYNTAQKADEEAKRALMQSQLMLAQAQQADKIGNRNYAAGLYEKAENFKSHAAQSKAKALEIMSTDKYHMGALQNAELVAKNNAAYQQGMLGYHQTMADIAKETKPTGEDLTNIRLNRLLESDPGYKALLAERALAAKDRDEDGYQLADKKLQNFLAAKRQELGLKPGVIPEAIQPKPTDTQESHWYDIFNPNTKARLKPSTNMGDLLSREDMPGMPRTMPSNMPNVVDFSKLPK